MMEPPSDIFRTSPEPIPRGPSFNFMMPIAYGPPPRAFKTIRSCSRCGIIFEANEFDKILLCNTCRRLLQECQTKLDQYFEEWVEYLRSIHWTKEQIHHALENALNYNKK